MASSDSDATTMPNWCAQAEKQLGNLFDHCGRLGRCILFLDEVGATHHHLGHTNASYRTCYATPPPRPPLIPATSDPTSDPRHLAPPTSCPILSLAEPVPLVLDFCCSLTRSPAHAATKRMRRRVGCSPSCWHVSMVWVPRYVISPYLPLISFP